MKLLILDAMGMMINRRRVCGGKNLPYDAEVEYLESSGTQYIDTGFKHSNNTRFVAKMSFVSISAWTYPFGSYGSENGIRGSLFCIEVNNRLKISSYYGSGSANVLVNASSGTIYTIDFNKNVHTVNNITVTFPERVFSSKYNDYFFGCTIYSGEPTTCKVRFYYFKIYDNDVLVRDFIPVRVGNVGYMYDKVSGQLFDNAGTGSFILGPDK